MIWHKARNYSKINTFSERPWVNVDSDFFCVRFNMKKQLMSWNRELLNVAWRKMLSPSVPLMPETLYNYTHICTCILRTFYHRTCNVLILNIVNLLSPGNLFSHVIHCVYDQREVSRTSSCLGGKLLSAFEAHIKLKKYKRGGPWPVNFSTWNCHNGLLQQFTKSEKFSTIWLQDQNFYFDY